MIAFVAGLSKSGKTSGLKHAVATLPDVEYVSVSGLLQDAGRNLAVKTFADALENQHSAAAALLSWPRGRRHLLVDGHALIETGEGPMLVPDWFFDQISPDAILMVSARPEDILSRRRSPTAGKMHVEEIDALGRLEKAACERTASRLDIPMIALTGPTLEEFSETLGRQLNES